MKTEHHATQMARSMLGQEHLIELRKSNWELQKMHIQRLQTSLVHISCKPRTLYAFWTEMSCHLFPRMAWRLIYRRYAWRPQSALLISQRRRQRNASIDRIYCFEKKATNQNQSMWKKQTTQIWKVEDHSKSSWKDDSEKMTQIQDPTQQWSALNFQSLDQVLQSVAVVKYSMCQSQRAFVFQVSELFGGSPPDA